MELKLNIYSNERDNQGNRKIVRTVESSTADMLYGPVEEILNILDLQNMKNMSKEQALIVIAAMLKQIKPILKDVFYDLTDEELKYTKTKEVVQVVFTILKFSIDEIIPSSNKQKN